MRFKINLQTFTILEKNENEIIQSHGNLNNISLRNAVMPLSCESFFSNAFL